MRPSHLGICPWDSRARSRLDMCIGSYQCLDGISSDNNGWDKQRCAYRYREEERRSKNQGTPPFRYWVDKKQKRSGHCSRGKYGSHVKITFPEEGEPNLSRAAKSSCKLRVENWLQNFSACSRNFHVTMIASDLENQMLWLDNPG